VAAHLTEEEQIEALKRWWKDYGTTVLVAAVLGLGGFFAWNQYQSYKVGQAQKASVIYDKFATAVAEFDESSEEDSAELKRLANDVLANNSSGLYADFATLYLAKLAVEQQDFASARTHLEKVANQGTNDAVKELAGLRLARVLVASGEAEQALTLLSSTPSSAYAAAYAEAKGDVLLSLKRLGEARVAYETALQALGTSQPMRRSLVQLKIDNTLTANDAPVILPNPHDPHGAHNPAQNAAEDA
jgi:predicted negative regulator of RcsB-dependent stress response